MSRARIHRVSESLIISSPIAAAWQAGNDPRKLSAVVPMLKRFSISGAMKKGAAVSEIHTILGYPQRFEGEVTDFEPGHHWAMATRPVTWGPASLPHSAEYRFESLSDGEKTRVEVGCTYELNGLLRLPGGAWFTEWLMSKAIQKILHLIEQKAACKNT